LASRSTYRSASKTSEEDDVETYYRVNVYYPLLDAVLCDFNDRFSNHFSQCASLCSLLLSVIHSKTWSNLKPAGEKYSRFLPGTLQEVEAEFALWKLLWKSYLDENKDKKLPETAISAVNHCNEEVYKNVFVLLSILATLPVSTCEAERMFSKVERTLTSIRSSMGEDRLESLLLMQAFRDELPPTGAVIDKFAGQKRRIPFVL